MKSGYLRHGSYEAIPQCLRHIDFTALGGCLDPEEGAKIGFNIPKPFGIPLRIKVAFFIHSILNPRFLDIQDETIPGGEQSISITIHNPDHRCKQAVSNRVDEYPTGKSVRIEIFEDGFAAEGLN
jgi:hypothetical protein